MKTSYLGTISHTNRIYIIGEGNGNFTAPAGELEVYRGHIEFNNASTFNHNSGQFIIHAL